ncbi:MAG: tetratricopeptide repeat protein [Bacteroidota bacterium]
MRAKLFPFIFTLFSLLIITSLQAQKRLTTSQWQQDLKFIQETVHKDYAHLFKKVTAAEFDSEVEKLYNEIPGLKDHEVVVGFARIISLFKYGHTDIGFRGGVVPHHKLPINLYHFNDGVYIEGAHKDHSKAIGAKIISIESTPIAEALRLVRPTVPAENDQYFKAFGINYLVIPEILHGQRIIKSLNQTVTFTLEKNGQTFEHSFTSMAPDIMKKQYSLTRHGGEWVSAREQDNTPYYLKHLDKIYYYEYIPEKKTVYVRQSQVQDDPSADIPTFYAEVFDFVENNDVEKLVIDVRLNGGGNNYKNKPVIAGIMASRKINKPGSLFVIIGRRTFSACQNLVNELDNYTNAIFVGEPSSENVNFYGDNRRVTLPNSRFPIFLSFAWWQDKPQWENADWQAPHLAVDMSFEEYKTNQDPVLDTVLNFENTNFLLDPMGYLTELFMKQEYAKVKTEAKRLVNDPVYGFVNFESELNSAGYRLMGQQQFDGAIFVLEMNTQLFPKSANTWDSLGEAYMKSKNFAKAKEYYNKAIVLDPNGSTGANARSMLEQMGNE